jgi:hypothetical protein
MRIFARIENGVVKELLHTEEDIAGKFHAALRWVEVSGQEVREGWEEKVAGVITPPAGVAVAPAAVPAPVAVVEPPPLVVPAPVAPPAPVTPPEPVAAPTTSIAALQAEIAALSAQLVAAQAEPPHA